MMIPSIFDMFINACPKCISVMTFENCMLRSIEERKFLKDDIESVTQEIEKMTNILSILKV